jgi:hypothetical protein
MQIGENIKKIIYLKVKTSLLIIFLLVSFYGIYRVVVNILQPNQTVVNFNNILNKLQNTQQITVYEKMVFCDSIHKNNALLKSYKQYCESGSEFIQFDSVYKTIHNNNQWTDSLTVQKTSYQSTINFKQAYQKENIYLNGLLVWKEFKILSENYIINSFQDSFKTIINKKDLFHIYFGHLYFNDASETFIKKLNSTQFIETDFNYELKNILFDLDMLFKRINNQNLLYFTSNVGKDSTNFRLYFNIDLKHYLLFFDYKSIIKQLQIKSFLEIKQSKINTFIHQNNVDSCLLKHNVKLYYKK